ncbi:cupin domain-containing protein [Dictyobacter kobayashii]|uniref:Cupin type-2 domain-containing protein n=1 Tax=Dictyobacter kobayashii TaxID=2014872 RepID=A0A402AQN4_9CHLR|nr:cupin domain-containing protein [Dictyobacter kobayashii]GCE21394.1 hypothetical protein KDK_51940 [Dictyobacter kobayashii]
MDIFQLAQLQAKHASTQKLYNEFLRVPTLSVGLYVLPAGALDPQLPHSEDEVYIVQSGQATIQVAGEDQPVSAGSIIFVAAGVDHRFHSITEDLSVLVFFAPAEYSLAKDNTNSLDDL